MLHMINTRVISLVRHARVSTLSISYKLTGTKTAGTGETITAYYNRMGIAALRYGVYLTKFIQAARDKGVDNIDYLMYFTEPSYS